MIFDFNGTISDDEQVLYQVFSDMFAEHGRPLSQREYIDHLAGLSDEAIMRGWLGERADLDQLVRERVHRYRQAAGDGSSVGQGVRDAVHYAASQVPVAIVSGAALDEVGPVIEAAGLTEAFTALVCSDHVDNGKPHPEGYLKALELLTLGAQPIDPGDVIAFEDTEAGVRSAKAAGMRCVAVLGTLPAGRLAAADEIVEEIDEPLLRRVLSTP